MVALATAFVRLRLDTSGVRGEVDRAIRGAGGEKVARDKGRSLGSEFSKGFGDGGSTFGRVAAVMAARATIATGAVAALTPVIVKFTAAVVPAAGVVVGLPAGLAAASAASGTFKVAISGVADAIGKGLYGTAKQYQEALANLAPAQRTVTREIVGMKDQIQGVRQAVSQRFFAPLMDDIRPLAQTYLPLARTEMGGLAGHLGQFGSEVARVARTSVVMNAVRDTFRQTGANVDILRGGIQPLGTAIAQMVSTIMPQLAGVSHGVVGLIERFAAWVDQASKSGRLVEIWNNAVTTIKNLWAIFAALGSIVRDVFGYANVSSGDFLTKLTLLTTEFARWVHSAQGAEVIHAIFQKLSDLGTTMRTTIGGVLPNIVEAFRQGGPVAGLLAEAVGRIVTNISPLLPALVGVSTQLLIILIPALQAFADWLGNNEGLVRGIAPYLIGFALAAKAVGLAVAVSELAVRAWGVAVGIARGVVGVWTGLMWLATAPMYVHNGLTAISMSLVGTWVGVKWLEFAAWVRTTAAAVASTTVMVASRVAMIASTAVTWLATAATTALGVAVRFLTGPIGIAILAITAMVGVTVYLWKNSETFRNIVTGVWNFIKTVIGAVAGWFTGTIVPSFRQAVTDVGNFFAWLGRGIAAAWNAAGEGIRVGWTLMKATFNATVAFITVTIPNAFNTGKTMVVNFFRNLGDGIANIWDGIKRNTFDVIRTWLTVFIPNAAQNLRDKVVGWFYSLRDGAVGVFKQLVDWVKGAWDRLVDIVKNPVKAVVDYVINPLISGYNLIGGVFGAPHADPIRLGFADGGLVDSRGWARAYASGGRIMGAPSSVDNRVARGPSGEAIGLATGEFVVNAEDTKRNLAWLEAVNAGARMPGFADGGLVGAIGGFLGKVWNGVKGVATFVSNPGEGLAKIANAALGAIPGGGFLRDVMVGMGRKIIDSVVNWFKNALSFDPGGGGGQLGAWPSSPAAQRGDSGVWRRIVALINSTGPLSGSFGNGYRPGDPLWHGSGRAVDWMGFNQDALATFLSLRRPLELIHRTNSRDYAFTRGVNKGSFNESLMQAHRNHVHIAMAKGGLFEKLSGLNAVRLLDRGGAWPSGTLGYNGSGHAEHVLTGGPDGDMAEIAELLRAILTALSRLGGEVADALSSNTRRAVQLGRGRSVTVGGRA